MRAAAITTSLALLLVGPAVAAPAETCLPPVGRLMPLAEPLVAQLGVLDITFDPDRHDAEFRGCALDGGATCELSLHKRVEREGAWVTASFEERGFGEAVTVPRDALAAAVRLPPCVEPEPPPPPVKTPPKPVKKPRRAPKRRAPEPAPPPGPDADPEAIARARIAGAPGVEALVEGAYHPGITFNDRPAPAPLFVVPEPGERLRIDERVVVEVAEDGTVTFHRAPAGPPAETGWWLQQPDRATGGRHRSKAQALMESQAIAGMQATARGEGLNALDGADIDAPIKRAYMEATRAARMAMYAEQRRRALNLAIFRLEDQLAAVRDSEVRAAEKAAAVFRLWAEASNETEAAVDGRHASAGAEARDHVESFVRRAWRRAPAGFDRAALVELHRANGWVPGKPVFDPYDLGVAAALDPNTTREATAAGTP